MAPSPNSGLLRSLRRGDLIAVVLNGVIGGGIFGLPSKVFDLAGNFSLLAFGACGLCVWFIVLSFAEVGGNFTGTGGPYLFARATFGETIGFGVGWLVWIARITSFAANLTLLPEYLGFFFPAAASGVPRAIILIGVVALLTWVNVRGVRGAAAFSNVFAVGKLLVLVVFVGVGLFYLEPGHFSLAVRPTYRGFSQSVMLLIYAFTGFEMAVIPAGEARTPTRDMPSALMIGMGIVVAVYVLIQAVCMGTVPDLASSHRPLADAASRFLGSFGAAMIMAGISVSLAGNLSVLILAASRLLFAMAEQGDLPHGLASVQPRFRTPAAALMLTNAVMLALALSGTFVYLVTLSTLARLVTYFATCAALPVLRRQDSRLHGLRLPGGNAIAAAGMATCLWLASTCSLHEVRDVALATAAGLVIYFAYRQKRSQRQLTKA
jgi:APA family basic amino acid/polyamine antiporter